MSSISDAQFFSSLRNSEGGLKGNDIEHLIDKWSDKIKHFEGQLKEIN